MLPDKLILLKKEFDKLKKELEKKEKKLKEFLKAFGIDHHD